MKELSLIVLLSAAIFTGLANFNFSNANEYSSVKCAVPKFDTAYKNAEAVFVGKVLAVEKDGDKKIIEFKIEKFWKGVNKAKVKISVYENFRFQSPYDVGETHLVFAKLNKDSEELWDGRCSRSKDLEGFSPDLKDDLEKLGEGKTNHQSNKRKNR